MGKISNHIMDDIGQLLSSALDGSPYRTVGTGFEELDNLTGGFKKSCVTIISGLAASGKTSLALNFVEAAIFNNDPPVPVLYYALSEKAQDIALKLIAIHTGIPLDRLKGGQIEDYEWMDIEEAGRSICKALFIEDNPRLEYDRLRKNIINKEVDHDVDFGLIIIDSINRIEPPSCYRGNAEQEISAISRELKSVAKELDKPIIAITPANRQYKQRGDYYSRLTLSDLKDSSSLEYDSDEVILINPRQDMGNLDRYELSLAKNRYGFTGDVEVRFDSLTGKFKNIDYETLGCSSIMNDETTEGGTSTKDETTNHQ